MNCQNCGQWAQLRAWLDMVGGQVAVDLCAACHARYEAMVGRRDWLPVPIQRKTQSEIVPIHPRPKTPNFAIVLLLANPANATPRPLVCVSKRGTALMSSSAIDLARLKCPDCGASYLDFRRTGRLGCPNDYVLFRAGILPLLDRVQRAKHHTGKKPRRKGGDQQRASGKRGLWRKLREAVQAEQYDLAARLRDEIRGKEGNDGPQ